jgi:hypothetical protein
LADDQNLRVRKIAPDGIITTIAGGPSSPLLPNPPAGSATGIAVDFAGNLFTSAGWTISASGAQSVIDTISGNGRVYVYGLGIAIDARGNLFLVSGNEVLKLETRGGSGRIR